MTGSSGSSAKQQPNRARSKGAARLTVFRRPVFFIRLFGGRPVIGLHLCLLEGPFY
jgi:hypothetical protein